VFRVERVEFQHRGVACRPRGRAAPRRQGETQQQLHENAEGRHGGPHGPAAAQIPYRRSATTAQQKEIAHFAIADTESGQRISAAADERISNKNRTGYRTEGRRCDERESHLSPPQSRRKRQTHERCPIIATDGRPRFAARVLRTLREASKTGENRERADVAASPSNERGAMQWHRV
jgi:hypothetical protein